jgi:hypothetical protein
LAVETSEETEEELLSTMTLVTESFDDLPASTSPAARATAVRHLVNQALGSQDFSGYLAVMTVDGGSAFVQVVSNPQRYNSGLGVTSPFSGGVYFMLGETGEDGASPTMIKAPSTDEGLRSLFGPSDSIDIPTDASITAAYSQPSAGTLIGTDQNTPSGQLPAIFPLPKAWITYFLGA